LLTPAEERNRANVFDIELLAHRLVDVTSWLTGQPDTASLRVGCFGASTGTGAALVAAADPQANIAAVVSRGGRPDLAGRSLTKVHAPTLLIFGRCDEVALELNRRIGGVDSRYGSTADQGRTGREVSSSRLWHPARTLGTHAKQGPSTGHSAVGLRQAGNALLTPRPHFTAHHARLVTRWFVLRTALHFVRSAVRLVYAELPGAGSGLLADSASWVIVSWVATASLSPVESSARRRPHRSLQDHHERGTAGRAGEIVRCV
jgi:hypothetical protein